jgi:uncharacterized protein with PIN domain
MCWQAGGVGTVEIRITVRAELHLFVPVAQRGERAALRTDGVSTLGHVVEALGVPLTEVGGLLVDGRPAPAAHVPDEGESVVVLPVTRPQAVVGPLRLLLDIHLGTLTRRLRLLGLDAAYENPDMGDAALAARSAAERRVMLSRDRGLLRRRELFAGAYVYSHQPAEQLDEVLTRFAPRLAPWTRCTACNGLLHEADREALREQVPDGTVRTYDTFVQCADCGQAYWRGAHHARLNAIVEHALRTVSTLAQPPAAR